MAIYFFDSSALVKRYALEEGRKWVQAITNPAVANRIHIARIAGAEVISAFMRKVRGGGTTATVAAKLIADFRLDFDSQYQIIEITEVVIARAMTLIESHKLRGYDGVQLAAALELNDLVLSAGMPILGVPALTLASADGDLNSAGVAEGLILEDPRTHLHSGDKTT